MVRVKQTPVTRTIQALPTRRMIFQTLYLLVGARNSSCLICSFELGGKQRASEIFYFAFKFSRNANNVRPDFNPLYVLFVLFKGVPSINLNDQNFLKILAKMAVKRCR